MGIWKPSVTLLVKGICCINCTNLQSHSKVKVSESECGQKSETIKVPKKDILHEMCVSLKNTHTHTKGTSQKSQEGKMTINRQLTT